MPVSFDGCGLSTCFIRLIEPLSSNIERRPNFLYFNIEASGPRVNKSLP